MPPSAGVRCVDLGEHVLLQSASQTGFERFLAAASRIHQTPRGQDDRELLGKPLVDRRLLKSAKPRLACGTGPASRGRIVDGVRALR